VHAAEAPRQRFVLLDVLLVFAQRGGGNHPDFTAREHRLEDVRRIGRRAERRAGAHQRVRLVHERDELRLLLELANDVLDPFFEHAAEHRSGDERVHLQVDNLAIAQPDRHGFRFELDAPGQAFGNGGLADAGLADQHRGIRPLAMAEDFEDLLNLPVAAEHRRQPVLLGEQVHVRGKLFQEHGKFEPLLQPLMAQFELAQPLVQLVDHFVGIGAVAGKNHRGHSLRLVEHRRDHVDRLDHLLAGAGCPVQGQLEDQLGRRGHAKPWRRQRRNRSQMRFRRLENHLRIQREIVHHVREQVPFQLREGEKQVFVREQPVVAAACFLDGAVHQSLGAVANLAR
jgi:hypothetical protein